MTGENSMENERKREYSLDVLKIVGTVIIMLHHFQGTFGVKYGPVDFANGKFYFGWIVELFFMLSGYFAVRYKERIENALSFNDYFSARVIRLVPTMFVCTAFYTLCFTILWKGANISL